jgi:cell wall-associated NlpC family hydrolase
VNGKGLLVAAGLAGVLLGSPLVLVLAAGVAAELTASSCGAPAAPALEATPGRAGSYGGVALSADQVGNAAAIYAEGRVMGVPDYGILIALTTAMGESTLRVLDYGDLAGPDSRGLFQQRDIGWGSLASRMSPAGSAAAFYRALLHVPGWEVMTVTAAAHEVQGNQDPAFYTPYASTGRALFASLAGSAVPVVRSATLTTPACTAVAADAAGPAGTDLGARAARAALQWLGVPYVWGGLDTVNGMDCSGMVVEAYAAAGLDLLARTIRTADDMYHSVTVLPITGLSPGDLVFSEISAGHAGHVGLYIGGGQVVEEPHPGDHEKIVSLTTYGWQAAGRLHL